MTNGTESSNANGSNNIVGSSKDGGSHIHSEKPEKFTGLDFKRWQAKMLFYLTTSGLASYLTEDPPVPQNDETIHRVSAVEAWKHSDFLCKNYILNRLGDSLYNVYQPLETAKEVWDSLEKKYKTESAGVKKFIVAKFLDFKMMDSKSVMAQVQEFQIILHELKAELMVLRESFQVAALIEKLPSSWKDFKISQLQWETERALPWSEYFEDLLSNNNSVRRALLNQIFRRQLSLFSTS